MSSNYELRVNGFPSAQRIRIWVVLNSWRDPRGKSIPSNELVRYVIPEVSPEVTYIDGYFTYVIGGRLRKQVFYAPFTVSGDKTVALGYRFRPKRLAVRI